MLLLDFRRYYIWLKVYYTALGPLASGRHNGIGIIVIVSPPSTRQYFYWLWEGSSGVVEHWNTAQKSPWYGPWEKSRRNLQIVVGKLGSYTHSLLSVLSNREDNIFRHIEWSLHYWPFIVECVLIKGPLRILVRKFWSYVFTITIGAWSQHISLRAGKVGRRWWQPWKMFLLSKCK